MSRKCEECGANIENPNRDLCDACFEEYKREQAEYEREVNEYYYSTRF